MKNIQTKSLKLNATKIKSSLFKNNKKLIKIKKDRLKIVDLEQRRQKVLKKEASIEFLPLKTLKNVGQKLLSGPLSLIDKFKEFFGLILLGILVKNLPQIIQKLQDVFGKIKGFFDQNPWIMDTVKWFGTKLAEGIVNLAKFIKFIRPYIGGSFKFALDTIKATKNKIGSLIGTFDELDLSLNGLLKTLDADKIPDVNKDPSRYSAFVAGGGKEALDKKGQTVDEVVEQGNRNIDRYYSQSNNIKSQQQTKPQPPQKLARGGTIKSQNNRSSQSTSRTPFARPGGTAKGRKAKQAVKSFSIFKQNVKDQSIDLEDQDKNYNMFEELLKKFKELQKLREKEKSGEYDGGGGDGGAGPGGGGAILPGDAPPEIKALMEAISGAEGGWNSVNPQKVVPDLTKMTISQAREVGMRQRAIKGSGALGAFQQIPVYNGVNVLKQRAEAAGLNYEKDLFSPENQTKITRAYLASLYGGEEKLLSDLKKNPMVVARKLRGVWPSLPGGSQVNVHSAGFLMRFRNAVTKYSGLTMSGAGIDQAGLPPLPPTDTLRSGAQRYGASRDRGRRKHAGVDFDISGNEKFYSRIGGVVVGNKFRFGDDGWAIDIYNRELGVYERVAEAAKILVKPGQKVTPGQAVAQGESRTGVIHYEIRTTQSGGFTGSVNPLNFLRNLSVSARRRKEGKETIETAQTTSKALLPNQLITQNFGLKVGQERTFTTSKGNVIKAYKTTSGFDFYTAGFGISQKIDFSGGKNKWVIDDFIKSNGGLNPIQKESKTSISSSINDRSNLIALGGELLNKSDNDIVLAIQPIIT